MEDSTTGELRTIGLLAAALEYARRGWYVFPVRVSIVDGKKEVQPGVLWRQASTTDLSMIEEWFGPHGLYRAASVAIDTGKSNLVVIDPDGPAGLANWLRLDQEATYRVATPGGGQHWYYEADPGHSVGNDSTGKVAPQVDVRGLGGFVIAPPSADARGAYRWLEGEPAVGERLPIVPALVRTRMGVTRAERPPPSSVASVGVAPDPFGDPAREFTLAQAAHYMTPILASFRAMRTPEDSGFNDRLNRLALEYAHFVPAFISYEQAQATMLEAASHNGMVAWPGGGGERGVLATIDSGLHAETWKAQVMPDPSLRPEGEAAGDPAEDPVELLLAKMLDRDAIEALPAPVPLIWDVLDLDSESWIIGAPGGFKSFVALDWSAHVALGLEWRGRPTTRGEVVYVAAEGRKGIPLRLKAWEVVYGREMRGVRFLPEPVQVANRLAWAVLVEACRRIKPVLIVLDTQARITSGLEENDATAMGVLIESVRQLKAATGACVLVVHHTGRNGEDARGSSAIDGAQDTEIRIDRPRSKVEREALLATISTDKQKDGDESARWDIQLTKVPLGDDPVTGRPLSSLALKPFDPFGVPKVRVEPDWSLNLTDNQADVLHVLRDHSDGSGATRGVIRRWVKERRALREAPDMIEGSYDSAVNSLVKRELATRRGARLVLTEYLEDD